MLSHLHPSHFTRALLLLVVVTSAVFAAAGARVHPRRRRQGQFLLVQVGGNFLEGHDGHLALARFALPQRQGPLGTGQFISRIQLKGTYSHRFTVRGTYKLFCSLHPGMVMTVTVR